MATGIVQKNWKLLWTNPDPTATFSPQDVSVDLSHANLIAIQFRNSTTNNSIDVTVFGKVGDRANAFGFNWNLILRPMEIYADRIYFNNATSYPGVATAGTTANNLFIPLRIYSVN